MMAMKFFKLLGACILALILSCNMFEPNEVDETKWYTDTGEYWLVEGKKKMQNQNWESALKDFLRARDYKNKDGKEYSEAYFYLGKCILRINEVDLNQVWDEINTSEESKDVPFLYNPEDAPDGNVLS